MGGKCHHGKQAEGSRCLHRALEEGHSRSNWRLNWDGGKDEATRLSFGGVFGCSENIPREREQVQPGDEVEVWGRSCGEDLKSSECQESEVESKSSRVKQSGV